MATEFFVVMQKRADGKVYSDLHKTDEKMYLLEEEVVQALDNLGPLSQNFHIVKMIAMTVPEWEELNGNVAQMSERPV